MYSRILVPLDGSEIAKIALPYAEELAGRLGSEIILLSVSESSEAQEYYQHKLPIDEIAAEIKRQAAVHLEKSAVRSFKVTPAILVGNPAEEIVDYAEKEDARLIIMATHGRSGITRWAMGSVVDKVVRATRRPVALIRAKGSQPDVNRRGMLQKALIPLDGSAEAEAVIPYVKELAGKLKIKVSLVQVVPPPYHVYADAEAYLEKVAEHLKEDGLEASYKVIVGTAAEEIIKYADEIKADLVAMTTHGRSGITRWAMGSITDRILRGGHTPVLLIRSPGAVTE